MGRVVFDKPLHLEGADMSVCDQILDRFEQKSHFAVSDSDQR